MIVNEFRQYEQSPDTQADRGNVSGQCGNGDGQFNPIMSHSVPWQPFSCRRHKKQVFHEVNDEGHFVRSIPAKGKIAAVTTLPSGNILATDMSNDQVQVT